MSLAAFLNDSLINAKNLAVDAVYFSDRFSTLRICRSAGVLLTLRPISALN
tara:strand:+ start:763 stop:915 length:153 start_codon:yes stop_codon:yes gene_type:complete